MKQGVLHHVPYLDGWRGLAIILVILDHFFGFSTGGIGVTLFFVLSGFLMARILFIKKTPLTTFYRRRIARIIPLFWLYIVVVFLLWRLIFGYFDLPEFIYTALFLRTYYPGADIFHSHLPIGQIWSLNVEEHSYIFLSLVTLAASTINKHRILLAMSSCICLIFFILYKLFIHQGEYFYLRSEVAAFPLLLSVTILLFFHNTNIKPPKYLPLCLLAAGILIPLFYHSVALKYFVASLLFALSINTLEHSPKWVLDILSNKILAWFGVCSYSIYIWQQLFFYPDRYFHGVWYYKYIAVTIVLIVSYLSYAYYEKPVRAWLSGRKVTEI